MIRKSFKRKVQAQRQRRSVTYMKDQLVKQNRVEAIKNAIAGAVLGFVMVFSFFYAADHTVEKRNEAIGVNYEQ